MVLRYFGFVAFGAALACAQINTGRITGSVTDASGSAVPRVVIRVTNEETGVVSSTASLAAGDYLVNFLVPDQNFGFWGSLLVAILGASLLFLLIGMVRNRQGALH